PHPFPTRRSSDLVEAVRGVPGAERLGRAGQGHGAGALGECRPDTGRVPVAANSPVSAGQRDGSRGAAVHRHVRGGNGRGVRDEDSGITDRDGASRQGEVRGGERSGRSRPILNGEDVAPPKTVRGHGEGHRAAARGGPESDRMELAIREGREGHRLRCRRIEDDGPGTGGPVGGDAPIVRTPAAWMIPPPTAKSKTPMATVPDHPVVLSEDIAAFRSTVTVPPPEFASKNTGLEAFGTEQPFTPPDEEDQCVV